MINKLLISFFFLGLFTIESQTSDTSMRLFRQVEQELQVIQYKAFHSLKEAERLEGNKEFLAAWENIISNPKILDYPFTALTDISILSPSNNKFKLITWNIHKNDGSHHYFGFLLVNNSKKIKKGFLRYETESSYEYFKLLDKSAIIKSPINHIGSPDKWFGMLYTQLIECDGYYTLIGWDGNDKLMQRKFVDALWFKSNGTPIFGKDVFVVSRRNPRRLMFEYSQEVSMSLKYVPKRKQIVYSHLASNQEGSLLEGQYQFYGPDGTFDALEQKKGKWVTVEDVDVKSTITPYNNSKKPNPKKQKPVYKPKVKP